MFKNQPTVVNNLKEFAQDTHIMLVHTKKTIAALIDGQTQTCWVLDKQKRATNSQIEIPKRMLAVVRNGNKVIQCTLIDLVRGERYWELRESNLFYDERGYQLAALTEVQKSTLTADEKQQVTADLRDIFVAEAKELGAEAYETLKQEAKQFGKDLKEEVDEAAAAAKEAISEVASTAKQTIDEALSTLGGLTSLFRCGKPTDKK